MRVLLGALLVSATFALAPAPLAAQRDSTVTVASQFDFEFVSDPQVSPDGRQIIFTRRWANTRTDQWDTALWIMDADGSRQRFLTNGGSPRWSPDGTRILYVATGERRRQVFVRWMDAEGATSQVTRLEHGPMNPAWSPDGKSIVFGSFVPSPSRWNIPMPARRRARVGTRARASSKTFTIVRITAASCAVASCICSR